MVGLVHNMKEVVPAALSMVFILSPGFRPI